jgi:hypothetical protein
MSGITVPELVRNGTMSAEMAAVLWSAVEEQVSFLTVAIPRFAGKTTTSNAVLSLRRPGVPAHVVAGEPSRMEQLKRDRSGGYVVVAEFDNAPVPGYIWGEPVRHVFETVHFGGYALQTSLHAPGAEEAIREVTHGNGVSDEHASIFKLVIYIERFGTSYSNFWRRVTDLYEVHAVEGGRPIGHSLFRWRAADDSFSKANEPLQFALDREDIGRRAALMSELAAAGRTSATEVAAALADYRASR